MAAHLTWSDCEGSNVVDGTDDKLWNENEVVGDVRSEYEADENRLWSWRWWHRLVKVDRIWHALCMKLIAKYFFLADVLFLGGRLDLDKYFFPWQMCFLGGSSWITVILLSRKHSIYKTITFLLVYFVPLQTHWYLKFTLWCPNCKIDNGLILIQRQVWQNGAMPHSVPCCELISISGFATDDRHCC